MGKGGSGKGGRGKGGQGKSGRRHDYQHYGLAQQQRASQAASQSKSSGSGEPLSEASRLSQASTATIRTGVDASVQSDEAQLHVGMMALPSALVSSARAAFASAQVKALTIAKAAFGNVAHHASQAKILVSDIASDVRSAGLSSLVSRTVCAARTSAGEVAHHASMAKDTAKGRAASLVAASREMASDAKVQATAAGMVGGAATLGTAGGATGLAVGSTVGAAVGLVPALFTFGLSIPIGATIGGAVGCTIGTAVGSSVGALGGSIVSYTVYIKRADLRGIAAKTEAGLHSAAGIVVEKASACKEYAQQHVATVHPAFVGGTGGAP